MLNKVSVQNSLILASFIAGFVIFSPSLFAKTSDIEDMMQSSSDVQSETLALPLLTGQLAPGLAVPAGASIFDFPFMIGRKGDLLFQRLDEKAVRIRITPSGKESAIFWSFEKPMDLRDRTLALHYAAFHAPTKMKLLLNRYQLSAGKGFDIYLEDSAEPAVVYFKLPNRPAFKKVSSIYFVIAPEWLENLPADFTILRLDLTTRETDPIKNLPATDAFRFDKPFEPENLLPFASYKTSNGPAKSSDSTLSLLLKE